MDTPQPGLRERNRGVEETSPTPPSSRSPTRATTAPPSKRSPRWPAFTTHLLPLLPSKEELLFSFPNRDPAVLHQRDRFKTALSNVLARDPAIDDITAIGDALRTLGPDIEDFRDRIAMLNAACATSAALRGRGGDATQELTRWVADAVAQRHGEPDVHGQAVARGVRHGPVRPRCRTVVDRQRSRPGDLHRQRHSTSSSSSPGPQPGLVPSSDARPPNRRSSQLKNRSTR